MAETKKDAVVAEHKPAKELTPRDVEPLDASSRPQRRASKDGPLTEAEAKKLARERNEQVPITGHPQGHVAYPDGKTVGPRQQR